MRKMIILMCIFATASCVPCVNGEDVSEDKKDCIIPDKEYNEFMRECFANTRFASNCNRRAQVYFCEIRRKSVH